MKVRKTLLVAAAGWAGLAARANAQLPVPPVAAPLGTPVLAAPAAAPPTTIWQKLGVGKDQKAACKAQLCATPFGQLISNGVMPLSALSGGMITPCCPAMPTAAQLADPGAEGAAAAIMADEAGAKARRAAVRYLGTVDCHYWPEAGDALIGSLRGDRNECVRWEAALALGRGCCCTKKTIEALSIVVSCSDRDGFPKESSYRVHGAAAAALDHCLSCYANVSTAPAIEKPTERSAPLPETIPPPQTPPPPPIPGTAAATPVSPSEAKPAPNATPAAAPAIAQRPVGPAYYARIAKAPLAAILTEARRVANQYHAAPVAADTPFQSQGASIATLMSYATGPDTQTVIPAGMTVPAGEVRAEVVSARPTNVWDLLTKPTEEGQVVNVKPATVVVQQPTPKPAVVKSQPVVVKPEVVVRRDPAAAKPTLVLAPPTLPAPMPIPTPMPKEESLTLDFPPPTPMPKDAPVTGPSPYYATAATPTIVNHPSEPVASAVSTYHPTAATPIIVNNRPGEPVASSVSTYHPTAATPTTAVRPSEPVASAVSTYHPTAATPTTAVRPSEPVASAVSTYHPTAATPTTAVRPSEPVASAVSTYHPTAATPTTAVRPTEPVASDVSTYHPTAATPMLASQPSQPMTSAVSAYHPTAATPVSPTAVVKANPTPTPYNSAVTAPAKPTPAPVVKAAPAPLPTPAALPATPLSTRPMPAPAAPVVPAATVPMPVPAVRANGEMIDHLLMTARGAGPVEVRKASIQELAKMKANTPDVMVALDSLADDPTPGVRAEAIIAAARLRMGR